MGKKFDTRYTDRYRGGPSKVKTLNDMTQFVQVECGQGHTLLLNNRGMVFSFGQGLYG